MIDESFCKVCSLCANISDGCHVMLAARSRTSPHLAHLSGALERLGSLARDARSLRIYVERLRIVGALNLGVVQRAHDARAIKQIAQDLGIIHVSCGIRASGGWCCLQQMRLSIAVPRAHKSPSKALPRSPMKQVTIAFSPASRLICRRAVQQG